MCGTETAPTPHPGRAGDWPGPLECAGTHGLAFLFWFSSFLGALILCKKTGILQGLGCDPDHRPGVSAGTRLHRGSWNGRRLNTGPPWKPAVQMLILNRLLDDGDGGRRETRGRRGL